MDKTDDLPPPTIPSLPKGVTGLPLTDDWAAYYESHGGPPYGYTAEYWDRAAVEAARAPLLARIAELQDDLSFVERWANHHAVKPTVTAGQALSTIQHYPAIRAITAGYPGGKVPDTPDPWAEVERLRGTLVTLNEICRDDDKIPYSSFVGINAIICSALLPLEKKDV